MSRAPTVKESWELEVMREAGRIVAQGHAIIREIAKPGISTEELDAAYEAHVRSKDAIPTFQGYRGFPKSICASINEEIVHGIPSPTRILQDGDILSIDCGATYQGYVGDAAFTMGIGPITEDAERLMATTKECLEIAIRTMGPGVRLSHMSAAIQNHAESNGYSIVKKYVGHGIGQQMHEEPQVPNYVIHPIQSFEYMLKPGIVLAVEPMLNIGTDKVKVLKDDWTVVTADGKLSAHFEHTIAVTETGREILTLP